MSRRGTVRLIIASGDPAGNQTSEKFGQHVLNAASAAFAAVDRPNACDLTEQTEQVFAERFSKSDPPEAQLNDSMFFLNLRSALDGLVLLYP